MARMTVVSGELEELGFDEVEPGIVEDTPENRSRIYELEGWRFVRVYDEDHNETGFIRPLSPDAVARMRESKHQSHVQLLVDPDDPWSDYKGPEDFPLDAPAPHWVLERLRRWRKQEREGIPEDQRPMFPIRCETFRHDGTRCWHWVSKPDSVVRHCSAHLKKAGADKSRIAADVKARLLGMSPKMADGLERLAEHGETHAVRLKAMTEILDRAGIRAGVDIDHHVEVELTDPSAEVRRKLEKLAEGHAHVRELEEKAHPEQATVVQGEVVADDPE